MSQTIPRKLHPNDLAAAPHIWESLAHAHQIPPDDKDWLIWLLLGGRGCGKTRAGAEWIRAQVGDHGRRRIALVAPTYNDAREVMLEGESGLLNIGFASERPIYISSRRRLEWPNGAIGNIFTSEEPDGLRGPQFDCGWADEFCAWRAADLTLSNLRLALRLGDLPRLVVTTTPKPVPALKALMAAPGVHISRAATQANQANLAPSFLAAMEQAYGGTRLGRQELSGEFIEDLPGALWSRAMIDRARMPAAQAQIVLEAQAAQNLQTCLSKIIIAIDPPVTSGTKADACGIIIAGLATHLGGDDGAMPLAIILADETVQGVSPQSWAQKVATLYEAWDAHYIVAEVNQGGEMIRTILHNIDPHIPVRHVYAHKSKAARAHPVAMLYEQKRVKHIGDLAALEDELCQMGTPHMGRGRGNSPDRADALVWAVTDLLIGKQAAPNLRQL